MKRELAETLDECIKRIANGETVEVCLADYPDVRSKIEPLLYTALSVSATPGIVAPEAFRIMSGARLLARIRKEAIQPQAARRQQDTSPFDILGLGYQWLRQALTGLAGMKRTVIPVALTVSLILGAAIGGLRLMWAAPALASQCTLSVFSGSVEIQSPEETSWQQGTDGMTLAVGDRVRTAINSGALLTFFEGSTIKLESETDVQIQQVERAQDESVRITLKQWLGRTWSRVVKMAGTGSHYEIETPSATAVVRGTLFSTIVDEAGSTEVATTSGLVSVVAQGEEVYLPPSQKTEVQEGSAPSQPETVPAIRNELVVRVDMPAVASLCDPTGSSTGTLLTGLSFNQIAGSLSLIPAEGTQQIYVPDPIGGEYVVALRYLSQGTANISIEAKSDDKLVFEHSGGLEADGEGGWLIRFNLKIENNLISGGEVVGTEPLGDEAPENIVEPEAAKESRIQSESPGQDKNNGSTQGVEQDQGQEDGERTNGKSMPDEEVDEDTRGFLDDFFKRVDEQTRTEDKDQSQSGKQYQDNNTSRSQPGKQDQDEDNAHGQPESQDKDTDLNPPDQQVQDKSTGQGPPYRQVQAKNTDLSPPDKQVQYKSTGQGPPDKQVQAKNTDLSQPDKQVQTKYTGQSQPDKQVQDKSTGQGQSEGKDEDTGQGPPDKQGQDEDTGQGQPDQQDENKETRQGQPDKQDKDKKHGSGITC